MTALKIRKLPALVLLLPCLLLAMPLNAGTKVKLKGSVEEVTQEVEGAFKELKYSEDKFEKTPMTSRLVAKNDKGQKLSVSVKKLGEDECELEISSAEEAEMEERFLRLMQSR